MTRHAPRILALAFAAGLGASAFADPTDPPASVTTKADASAKIQAAFPNMAAAPAATPPGGLQPVQGVPVPDGCPLKFETTVHDWGKIPDSAPVNYEFKFTNTTDREVMITNVSSSCGCTSVAADPVVKPGASSVIRATFNPTGRNGRDIKTINVALNDPACALIQLTTAADVQKRIIIEPMSVFFGEVEVGKGAAQELSITGRPAGFAITAAAAEGANIALEPLGQDTVQIDGVEMNRSRYRVTLDPKAPMGASQGKINLTTNQTTPEGKPETLSVAVLGNVMGDIRVSPERLPIRLLGQGEPFAAEMSLMARGSTSFEILEVSTDLPPSFRAVVDVTPFQAGNTMGYRIRLAGTAPAANQFTGNLIIKTTTGTHPVVTVPLQPFLAAPMTSASPVAKPVAGTPAATAPTAANVQSPPGAAPAGATAVPASQVPPEVLAAFERQQAKRRAEKEAEERAKQNGTPAQPK